MIGLALAIALCATAMGAEQVESSPSLPDLDDLVAVITTDTVDVARASEFDLPASRAGASDQTAIVLEAIVTHPDIEPADALADTATAGSDSPLADYLPSRYVSIFEPMVVTISISYLPGEHSVSFDSRPPGMLAMAADAVLHFPSDEFAATTDGLAILTTTQPGQR
jgi:hypothetical protein